MESAKPDLKKLAGMIKDMKFTMLTTVDTDGSIHSRPMATLKINEDSFDGNIYFFTKINSPKVHSIENDQHVNLAYSEPDKQRYVSVSGRASVIEDRDKMKEFWNPAFKAWFPEGLEDPEISLISVSAESAELWDSPPSKVVQMVGFAKSIITGKPYDSQSHSQQIDIQH